jgi:hypothetical protein
MTSERPAGLANHSCLRRALSNQNLGWPSYGWSTPPVGSLLLLNLTAKHSAALEPSMLRSDGCPPLAFGSGRIVDPVPFWGKQFSENGVNVGQIGAFIHRGAARSVSRETAYSSSSRRC